MPGEEIPWSELSDQEKRNFQTVLHGHGIKVPLEECQRYYGNRELIEREATKDPDVDGPPHRCPNCMGPLSQAGMLIEGTPGDCPHCGESLTDAPPERLASMIETREIQLTPGEAQDVAIGSDLMNMSEHEFLRNAVNRYIQGINKAAEKLEHEQEKKKAGEPSPIIHECPECGEPVNPVWTEDDQFECPECGNIGTEFEFEPLGGSING